VLGRYDRAQLTSVGCARFAVVSPSWPIAAPPERFHRDSVAMTWLAAIESPREFRQRNKMMARKSNTVSNDIVEIEREIGRLMHDLETRVGRLNALARRGGADAASGAGEYVSDALADAAERMRNGAAEAADRMRAGAQTVSDEASRLGGEAVHKIEDEINQRPLLTLAIAAGIGFLAGMAGRRH
jgi:ElaB/YqjD/DUF883 family membrane-anchored ribosome-binding protein